MSNEVRKIITIDEDKCDGCGLCIPSCEEGALQIVDGKARLVKDIYCDGLGNCLGECPQGAIKMIEREAEPFNQQAVEERLVELEREKEREETQIKNNDAMTCGTCCGSAEQDIGRSPAANNDALNLDTGPESDNSKIPEAELTHWPVQLHLVPADARFLQGQDLLIAADCVPFAHADFHQQFLAGRALVIGCPKLDDLNSYHDKLVKIFNLNSLKSIKLVHMEVGCCFGLSKLVNSALQEAGLDIPLEEIIVGVDGSIKN